VPASPALTAAAITARIKTTQSIIFTELNVKLSERHSSALVQRESGNDTPRKDEVLKKKKGC
jgi:hypothetical protein